MYRESYVMFDVSSGVFSTMMGIKSLIMASIELSHINELP